jgi:hypothetical protein
MFAVVHRWEHASIFFRKILETDKFISLTKFAVDVLVVKISIDFCAKPTMLIPLRGRWCI